MNIKGRAILVGYVVRINYGEAKGWGGLSCEWACARVCVCVCVCVCVAQAQAVRGRLRLMSRGKPIVAGGVAGVYL